MADRGAPAGPPPLPPAGQGALPPGVTQEQASTLSTGLTLFRAPFTLPPPSTPLWYATPGALVREDLQRWMLLGGETTTGAVRVDPAGVPGQLRPVREAHVELLYRSLVASEPTALAHLLTVEEHAYGMPSVCFVAPFARRPDGSQMRTQSSPDVP
jgi:hypothetical protein